MYRVFVLSWAKHSQNWISFLLNIEVSTILNKDEAARSQCKLWIWISAQLRSRLKADIRVGLQTFHISFITVFKTKIGLINVDIHSLSLTSCTVSIARKSFCYWKIQPEIKYNVFCYFLQSFVFLFLHWKLMTDKNMKRFLIIPTNFRAILRYANLYCIRPMQTHSAIRCTPAPTPPPVPSSFTLVPLIDV